MSASRIGPLGETLRTYSIAVAFVLGQIAPLTTSPPRQPPAIVRTRSSDRDAMGFDSRERLPGGVVLTTPLLPASDSPTGQVDREPDWLRDN